jgi:hypothetical protein
VIAVVDVFRDMMRLVEGREILRNRARCLLWLGPIDGLVTRHTFRLVDVRLDQAGVDRERLATNQTDRNAADHHALEHASEYLALAEALVPGAREDRVVRDLVLNAQTTEPAVRQIDLNLGTDPSLRPDRKHVADQQHSDHQFRVDRGASGVAVERRKLLVDPAKIEHSINPPYHVIGWNHFIEMECVEELRLARCQPTHHVLTPDIDRVSSPNHASPPPSIEFCNTIPPEADMLIVGINVCYVPEADTVT